MTITVDMIKELRERTGVGMAKCKKALEEANGSLEDAISNLRKSGMASAVKKEGRETNEGMIGFAETDSQVAIVEVNAETDFVVKNDNFQAFVQMVAQMVAESGTSDVESLMQQTTSTGVSLEEARTDFVQKIGENIQVRRIVLIAKGDDRSVGVYSHMGGRILTAVELSGASDEASFAREIAMHIAASQPEYLSEDEIPAETVEQEKEIARAQVAGKPENVMDKIISGKLNAFYKQTCLIHQPYIRDEKMTVGQVVESHGKSAGKSLSLVRFVSWQVGG